MTTEEGRDTEAESQSDTNMTRSKRKRPALRVTAISRRTDSLADGCGVRG